MKAKTFNKNNECAIQDGIAPSDIIYCGPIDAITDSFLAENGLSYNDIAELLAMANGKEDEDSILIYNVW